MGRHDTGGRGGVRGGARGGGRSGGRGGGRGGAVPRGVGRERWATRDATAAAAVQPADRPRVPSGRLVGRPATSVRSARAGEAVTIEARPSSESSPDPEADAAADREAGRGDHPGGAGDADDAGRSGPPRRPSPRSIGPARRRDASIGPRDAAADPAPLDPDDPEVLERAREGDPAAVKAVVDACLDPVHATCHRMLGRRGAADVAQDAIVRIVSGLPRFDGRAAVTTWAIRIAMNACLGHLRRERYRRHLPLDSTGGAPGDEADRGPGPIAEAGEPGPAEGVQHEESVEAVRRALSALDPSARAILVLRDMQGLEYDRIAEALDVPVGTVKSRLFRARAALRERLERLGHGPADADPDAGEADGGSNDPGAAPGPDGPPSSGSPSERPTA